MNINVPVRIMVALADVSRKYARYIPEKADTAPIIGEIHNMRAKEFVSMRATEAGITKSAEMRSVPITRIVTRMVRDRSPINNASIHATCTPET
jgi:hypothetical protein